MRPYRNSPSHLLRSVYLRLHRVTNRALLPHGVTADQFVVMRLLAEGDGITQQEVADVCASDPTTVGRMLDLLEQKRFVIRRGRASDRRARVVYLTAQGRRTVKKLYGELQHICAILTDVPFDPDARKLRSILRFLVGVYEEMEEDQSSASAAGNSRHIEQNFARSNGRNV